MQNQSQIDVIKSKVKETLKPIEANVVGALWKNPELYFDYKDLNKNIFKNNVWTFYFTIGQKIANKGIKEIDDVAVEIYLADNNQASEVYEKYGGFDTIDTLELYINEENIDYYINELKKWSAVYDFAEYMTVSEQTLDDLKDLNSSEVYNYFNAIFNNIFINAEDNVEAHNLDDGLEDVIEIANKGLNVGMPIPSPILSNEIGGIMKGQIYLMGGLSGTGKTTFTIQMMLASVFENEEPCVIMLNEQDHIKWKQELLTWIINNKLIKNGKDSMFLKKRWRQGKFNKKETELLYEAKTHLETKMKNNKIILIHFKSYSRKQAERVIRKYASMGVDKFVLDTFKLSSDKPDNESFWLSMQEDMRHFDDLIKPSNLNVTLWATLQLQKGSALRRYLTGDSIGMAKNVIDVASVGILMRRLRNDEYEGGKYEIKIKNPVVDGLITSGIPVKLDQNKKYVIIFIEKNRNGESQSYQIVAEQDLGYLTYKEIGICDIPFDS